MTAVPESFDHLASPLADDAPSGPDLSYDPDFMALEAAGAGKPERQYGDTVYPAEPPDWEQVYTLALGLADRTRDLRVAAWLTRAATRLHGLRGAACGFSLVHRLVQDQWDTVHPVPDPEDGDDPVFRVSAVAPLFAIAAFVADLRAATVAPARGSMRVREVELGLGLSDPHGDESAPSREGVLQALAGLVAEHPEVAELASRLDAAARGLAAALDDRAGAGASPESKTLLTLTRSLASSTAADAPDPGGEAAATGVDASAPGGDAPESPRGSAGGGAGEIRSRADALRELERVCAWLEKHEPSNPAPLLIRRAQRLINMNFLDIMRDLAPEAYDQVARLSGITDSN